MKSFLIVVFCIVSMQLGDVFANHIINYCNSPGGTIKTSSVNNCKDSDAFCPFHRGKNVTLKLDFVANKPTTSAQVKIVGELSGVPIPFDVNPSEACGNYGLNCPLKAGELNHFKLDIPIKTIYPNVPVLVRVQLFDPSDVSIACIEIHARIVD